jgi:hypothetical protein
MGNASCPDHGLDEDALIVLKKLNDAPIYNGTSHKNKIEMSRILSSVKQLRNTYFQTSYVDLIGKETKSTDEHIESCSDFEPIVWETSPPTLKKALGVKLVISNLYDPGYISNMKNSILSKLGDKLDMLPEYGMFHVALLIGPYKIEWTNTGLCIPRGSRSSNPILCIDLAKIDGKKMYDEIITKLIHYIVDWNLHRTYCKTKSDKSNKGNCQMFVDGVLGSIGIKNVLSSIPKPFQEYLRRVRLHGHGIMEFHMSIHFRNIFNIIEDHIVFRTHQELDDFVNRCIRLDCTFLSNYKSEAILLKAFDRAFWLKHKKQPCKKTETISCPFHSPDLSCSIMPFPVT